MSKIWMVNYGNYTGRKYYKTEAAFIEAIRDNHTKATVTIFEEIESSNALEYKTNLILQREREQQLSIILDNNQEAQTLLNIKSEIENFEKERIEKKTTSPNQWAIRNILKKLENRGMSFKVFKLIVTDNSMRKFLLYHGPDSVDWYKLLFRCHNFSKMEKTYGGSRNPIKVPQHRLDNFLQAKEEIKKEKKNEKKNISV